MSDTPTTDITERGKYVEWCKTRARKYLEMGRPADAVASMINDMNSRRDCHVSDELATLGLIILMQDNYTVIKRYIEGFN